MMWSYDNSMTFELVLHETSRGGPAQIIFFCSLPCRPGFEPKSGRTGQLISLVSVRVGVVGNISACHADARGSIPRRGGVYFFLPSGRQSANRAQAAQFPSGCLYSSVGRASPS